ncbi:MAG: hypothetical protein ABID38_06265 [Candidatus Diapherotrites archaeon]
MSKYIKALILTLFIVILGIFLIMQLDNMRLNSLDDKVDEIILDMDSTRLFLLYNQVEGDEGNYCDLLEMRIESQAAKAYNLVKELEAGEKASFLTSYDLLKRKYFYANLELYLYMQDFEKQCKEKKINAILFFYKDQVLCNQCLLQGTILDKVRDKCPNTRIFAFPGDLEIDLIDLMMDKHKVTSIPSIVVNGKTRGFSTEEEIEDEIGCVI